MGQISGLRAHPVCEHAHLSLYVLQLTSLLEGVLGGEGLHEVQNQTLHVILVRWTINLLDHASKLALHLAQIRVCQRTTTLDSTGGERPGNVDLQGGALDASTTCFHRDLAIDSAFDELTKVGCGALLSLGFHLHLVVIGECLAKGVWKAVGSESELAFELGWRFHTCDKILTPLHLIIA